ncbi:septation protein SepH [Georgenia sp. SYP-B2076]|uniref:septation protein SepH n=1 Tax=Georgenia sp. SYP-B2076 TaxID=2495881 RepID=UPI000F8F73EC|nr:septation protein SepH [Georgenia sp. SYP-B2076]
MVELELLGLHGDGEHLTLTDGDGRRYRLAIDDALRAAVRRDRPGLEALRAAGESALRPKEIQSLIRAGASVEEVAERSGLTVEHIRRYEGPVLAERAWAVQQAQAQQLGHEPDAPHLGELVVDRLAARGVDSDALEWDAVRRQGHPWEVIVTFVAGGREREARWQADLAARTLHALDDESRWLSETEVGPMAQPRRHLTPVGSVRPRVYDAEADDFRPLPGGGTSSPSALSPLTTAATPPDVGDGQSDPTTDALLAELSAHRGTRVLLHEVDDDEDDTELWRDAHGAHPAASRPEEATDAHVLSLPRRELGGAEPGPDAPGTTPALPAEQAPPGVREAIEGTHDASPHDEDDRAPASRAEDDAGPGTAAEPPPRRRQRSSGRRSVPSWDEIVFGAKPE